MPVSIAASRLGNSRRRSVIARMPADAAFLLETAVITELMSAEGSDTGPAPSWNHQGTHARPRTTPRTAPGWWRVADVMSRKVYKRTGRCVVLAGDRAPR